MNDFRSLKVLDRFRQAFEWLGADYGVMRKILQVKLTLDSRRVPTVFSQSARRPSAKPKQAKDENQFVKSMWFYGLLGLLLIVPFVLMGQNYVFQMSIVFSVLMFLIATAMISDFSTVLLDVRDKPVLYTKPISPRTIGMAKAVHIGLYLFFLTASVTAAPLVAGLIRHGIAFALLFAAGIVLSDIFILVLTALMYLLVLRFFDGEKLKDMINYVQIALSVAIMVGYQFAARAFDLVDFRVAFAPKWWLIFIPPVWFGSAFEWLLGGNGSRLVVVLALLALVVPVVSMFAYAKLMPSFERNLLKLSQSGAGGGERRFRRAMTGGWSRLICAAGEERTFFRFAWNMLGNERDFKLKVYPSLGFSLIFPFIFLFNALQDQSWDAFSSGKSYLTVYFSLIVIPTLVIMLKYSGKYKGAWIYRTAPLTSAAPLYKGTLKAVLVKLFLPVFVVVAVAFTLLYGVRIVPDLIAVLLASYLYAAVCFQSLRKALPFSEPFAAARQREGMLLIPLMFVAFGFAGLHYAGTSLCC
jgi:hypothetical protein